MKSFMVDIVKKKEKHFDGNVPQIMNIEQCMVVERKFKPLEKRKNRTKIFSR